MKKSYFVSILVSLIMSQLLTFFICFRFIGKEPEFIISGFYVGFLTGITFLIYKTGKTSRYRLIFFSSFAILFSISFMAGMVESRGSFILKDEDLLNLNVPFCHMVIFMTILPAILKQILIFPTPLVAEPPYGFYPMLFLWLVGTLILGRGWCSFVCFFGGWDELCSKIMPKVKMNIDSFARKGRLFPFAFMVVLALWSLAILKPIYCIWFCPFKATTEFLEVTNLQRYIQTVIFISLFVGLVIILPLLTKRRIQCGLFCPFGAFQSVVGLINPYRIRIDKDRCTNCKRCQKLCPVFAIQDDHIIKGGVSITCTRCGLCMQECPKEAINYTFIGNWMVKRDSIPSNRIIGWLIKTSKEVFEPRTLFIFSAITFFGIFSAGFVVDGIHRLIHLLITGSLLLR